MTQFQYKVNVFCVLKDTVDLIQNGIYLQDKHGGTLSIDLGIGVEHWQSLR